MSKLLYPSTHHGFEWIPGSFPIPFFQTWRCRNSIITGLDIHSSLINTGLEPGMLDCVLSNLRYNNVGVDCVHYLYNDVDCRRFLVSTFPPDVVIAYDRLIPTAFKADLWRYCVLYIFGGVYLDIKYQWTGCGCGGITLRNIVERWLLSSSSSLTDSCCTDTLHSDTLLVLERDAPGLWPEGHRGIHNAFMLAKPKSPLLLECIYRIVSYSRASIILPSHLSLSCIGSGCVTLPLFITGPGLLGDVWRHIHGTSAFYDRSSFQLFFKGDGVISYDDESIMNLCRTDDKSLASLQSTRRTDGHLDLNPLLCVYSGYYNELNCDNVPHYTLLWSRGIVWKTTT